MKRRLLIAALALLVFGAVRLGFLAALSGFRALVADALWLHASTAWERTEWGVMKVDFDAVTTLQPRCVLFWDMAAWHMFANASIAAYEDRKHPREALRLKAQREYWKLGEDYLIRGIANNPESATLYTNLGTLYRDRFKDPCKAADAYARGAALPDAPVYLHRFALYEMARCGGRDREAYEKMLALYRKGEDERLPTLLKLLGELQEKLNVPAAEKVDIPPQP
jgi:hypothetical protein